MLTKGMCCALVALFAVSGAFAAYGREGHDHGDCTTVAQAIAETDSLTTLGLAAEAAGYLSLLNDTDLEATIFAPTNEAFGMLLAIFNTTASDALMNLPLLKALLQYHIVPEVAAKSSDVVDGLVAPTLLGNQTLAFSVDGGMITIEDAFGQNVTVIQPDIMACKSVVHIVDHVFIPELELVDDSVLAAGEEAAAVAAESTT